MFLQKTEKFYPFKIYAMNKKGFAPIVIILTIVVGLLAVGGGAFYFYQNRQKADIQKQSEIFQQKEENITSKKMNGQANDDISLLIQKIKMEENSKKYKEYIYQLIKFGNRGVEALKEIIKTTNNELLVDDILEILVEKEKIMTENEAAEFLIKTRFDLILKASDELLAQARDAQRISGQNALKSTIGLYFTLAEKPFNNCMAGKIYSSNKGTNAVDGSGWLLFDLTKIPGGSPLLELLVDPQNAEGFIYRFACDPQNFTFEFNAKFESNKYKEEMSTDGGNNSDTYEIGTDLNLIK